ncbi:hypothetical protein HPB49_013182 [Dermacentor silvarum]|uniref:Uncharacterized protein n=1 Tax=Dermacentor silvarum TaxID=543639 RepID=A0ACB8C3W3_DERSI|nr:uncharacterized protein LOC119464543 [Dermacentor silvarum]KAH7933490.1 hypothetical protein HPB49_013182 [Dermacentor silvarum]
MAARIVRTSVCSCVRLQATLASSVHSRCLATSRALLVRGTKLSVEREDRQDEQCADDDFYGISSDRGVVTVDNPLGDRHERLRRFSHLTRSRNARVSDENVLVANYGTIRYDSDNKAKYHGQFEDDTLLDDFVLDIYGRDADGEQKGSRVAPVKGSNESERQNQQEGSVSARKAARKKKKSVDSVEGAIPVGSERQDVNLVNATVKLSQGVARTSLPQSAPVDDRRVVENSGSKSEGVVVSRRESLETVCEALNTEQNNNMQVNDRLESVVGRLSPAEDTAAQTPRSAKHFSEQGDEGLSDSGVSSPATSTFESFVTSVRTSEDLKSSVSETRATKPRSKARRESDDTIKAEDAFQNTVVELRQEPLSFAEESSVASQDSKKTKKKKAKEAKTDDEKIDSSSISGEHNPTAFEYLRKPQQFHLKLDSKGFLILKSEVRPNLTTMLRSEVVDLLRQRVLYDGNDILILDKPYGMICHGSAKGVPDAHVLVRLLPDLSSALYPQKDVKLYTVHRLDRDVTGTIVLAKTQQMADVLQTLFEERNVIKTYQAITFGVPDNEQATIDMPLAEGSVGSAKRMVICPKLEPDFQRLVPKFSKTYEAVTHYRVLRSHGRAAYLELKPVTGVKHQIRVHLGFGLRCPILGDHKYSHLRHLGPQKLSGDILNRLNVRQTKARHIPMHLHSSSVLIPEILDGRNLFVAAKLPYHFVQNLKRLNLHRHN